MGLNKMTYINWRVSFVIRHGFGSNSIRQLQEAPSSSWSKTFFLIFPWLTDHSGVLHAKEGQGADITRDRKSNNTDISLSWLPCPARALDLYPGPKVPEQPASKFNDILELQSVISECGQL